jgi:hypothetical protein
MINDIIKINGEQPLTLKDICDYVNFTENRNDITKKIIVGNSIPVTCKKNPVIIYEETYKLRKLEMVFCCYNDYTLIEYAIAGPRDDDKYAIIGYKISIKLKERV